MDEAVKLTSDVAEALQAAHEQGVIHRDIKPANILLSRGSPLVADFGIALAVSTLGGDRLTETGLSVGTPHYMSPEQAAGERHVDARSDTYSLAAILYEMLAGELPYTGRTAQVILAKRLTEPVPSVRRIRDKVPASVDAAIQRALAPVPADRFATPGEFIAALTTKVVSEPEEPVRWKPWAAAGVAAALVSAIGLGIVLDRSGGVDPAADALGRSIAVLPFTNMSGDEENAYFTQGIHDDILTQLSKIGALDVIARTSVLQYADTEKTIPTIAGELGVATVVEGGVQRAGNRVRINAQLIHAESNTHLWAETYDRELTAENIFAVQTEIAQQIADALRATLTPEEESRIARVPTGSLTAYDFYLKGREAYQRYLTEDNDEAIRLFGEALKRDPDYARAWAGLSDAFGQRVSRFGFAISWLDSAMVAGRRAIEIDAELADGYKALGLAYSVRGDRDQALTYYRRTVELDPNHVAATNNIGVLSFDRGEFDEYLRRSRRGYDLEPTSIDRRTTVAWAYWSLGEYQLAERWALEALALQPDALGTLDVLSTIASHRGEFQRGLEFAEHAVREYPGALLAHQVAAGAAMFAGDLQRAKQAAEEAARLDASGSSHHWHMTSTMLGFTLLATGETERGRRHLTGTLERTEAILERDSSWTLFWEMASINAALGNVDEAIRWAERSYEERGYRFPRFIAIDPFFNDVRDNPRFQALIARMETDIEGMRREMELEETAAGLR